MKRSPPSIIPLSYDYQKMSPSSVTNQTAARSDATTTFYDNQYQSLFGDPVPPTPSEDYLGHLDGSLYGSFRRESYASAISDDFNRTITLAADGGRRLSRLFSETPITSTSMGSSPMKAPDIQILPDSGSAHSSSDAPRSVNYALLRPDVTVPQIDEENDQVQDVFSSGLQDYVEHNRAAKEVNRRISDFSEDFKSNVGSLRESPPEIPEPPSRYTRQISTESYSSAEWFKPMNMYPEFTKMPKLRPSSKNVLSIKHHELPSEDSPVAAMIHDSNGSSSGEDQRKMDPVPARPPDPQPSRIRTLQQQSSFPDSMTPKLLPSPPPPPPPAPVTIPTPELEPTPPIVRQMSPIILTDAITTGADHRVTATRTHKKTSFTIIGEKSQQSSRPQSPQKVSLTGRISPFRGHGFREPEKPIKLTGPHKPFVKPRMMHHKSLSSIHLRLPSIAGPTNTCFVPNDSPRPSVQFNMSGKRVPMVMTHQKGILQMGKDQSSSSQETTVLTHSDPHTERRRVSSCEALPLITDPYRTSIPRLSAATRPIFSNSNPTRKQRGLLRVINSADSNSRIPVRSNWASMDDVSTQRKPNLSPLHIKTRRRSSSTSPERRSSTQTEPRSSIASDRRSSNLSSVTTSDFSFRRHSVSSVKTPLTARKSIFHADKTSRSTPVSPSNRLRTSRTPRKIVKPTTLSPIIGTPNKDLPQTAQNLGLPISISLSRRESLSKIPIRNSPNGASRSNSRVSSRVNSLVNSRSSSPLKDLISPRVSSSRSPSGQTLRPNSRHTKSESRPVSRAETNKAPSRSTSRASTRQVSRATSQANSRGSSRPTSRMEHAKAIANSRSNSRLSTRSESPIKSRKASPPKTRRRSKSSTRSPILKRLRRKSISVAKAKSRTPIPQRKNSKSLIPARISASKTSPKSTATTKTGIRRESPKRASERIQLISAKKTNLTSATKDVPKAGKKNAPSDVNNSRKTLTSVRKSAKPASSATITAMKNRQSSNLQARNLPKTKTATEVKRESSSVRQAIIAAALLKKEGSALSIRKGDAKNEQPLNNLAEMQATEATEAIKQTSEVSTGSSKFLKRQPSTMTLLSIGSKLSLIRKRTDSNLSKKLDEMKKSAEGAADSIILVDGGEAEGGDAFTNGKLVALTKPNVVSMTTAAITAQPVQISTVLANQLPKTTSSGQLLTGQEDMALPAAILEKSQKTLENVQKTVTEATDEIQKTINENLSNLKTLESDMEKMAEELTGSPLHIDNAESTIATTEKRTPSNVDSTASGSAAAKGTTYDAFSEVVQTSTAPTMHPIEASVTVVNAKDSPHPSMENGHFGGDPTRAAVQSGVTGGLAANEDSAERVSERAISVLPEIDCESANLQSNDTELIEEAEAISRYAEEGGDSTTTRTKHNLSYTKGETGAGDDMGRKNISKEYYATRYWTEFLIYLH